MRILKFISRMDDNLVNYFQRFCNWFTRKTGMGYSNIVFGTSFLFIYVVMIIFEKDYDMLNMFLIFNGCYLLFLALQLSDEVFKLVPIWVVKFMRVMACFTVVVVILHNRSDLRILFIMETFCYVLALYFLSCKGLPPCKGELWEKKDLDEPVGQESKA